MDHPPRSTRARLQSPGSRGRVEGATRAASRASLIRRIVSRPALACGLSVFALVFASTAARARTEERKLAEMELLLLGVSATVEPENPVIPKNTEAGVRIVLKAGERELSLAEAAAFFGGSDELERLRASLRVTPGSFDEVVFAVSEGVGSTKRAEIQAINDALRAEFPDRFLTDPIRIVDGLGGL